MPNLPCHKKIHSQSDSKQNFRRDFYGVKNDTLTGK